MFKTTYTVDGVPLDDPADRWFLEAGSRRRSLPAVRATRVSTPGRSGSFFTPNDTFEDGQFGLSVIVTDKDAAGVPGGQTQVEKNIELLTGLLAGTGRLMRVEHRIGLNDVRVAYGRVAAGAEPEPRRGLLDRYLLRFVVEVPGVFWSDGAGPQFMAGAAPTASGTLHLPILDGGSAPITDATVRFAGPFNGRVSVADARSGTGLSYQGNVPAGTFVFLNAGTLKAHTSTNKEAWDTGTDVSGGLDYPPAGPLQITPSAQSDGTHYAVKYTLPAAKNVPDAVAVRAERKFI